MRKTAAGMAGKIATGIATGFANTLGPLGLVAGMALTLLAAPAGAQDFTPAATVDGEVITVFELEQRQRFLTLLRAPGDVRTLAFDQLVNERLQVREAEKIGVTASEEAVDAGVEEFAARGNLTGDQFLQLLAQGGIAPESFRDFVAAGVTWREFVQANFGPMVSISKTEIAIAFGEAEPAAGLRVLLNEIALPAGDPATRRASQKRAERLVGLEEDAFREAAKRFSVARTRNDEGEMKWVDVSALPPAIGAAVRGLQPGQTTRALPVGEQIRIYYMREREEVKGGTPATVVDYAALLLAGGATDANLAAAAKIRADVTACDDLYPFGRALPPEQLIREQVREAAVPAPFGAELALLDPGEISTRVTTAGGALAVLMLCSRGNELPRSTTEEMVAAQLTSSRASAMAQSYLDELKANAQIEILR
ncbi:MAG TPA: peptidylprolyl isomerase [Rhodobacteraceae bacterium]|nr:peptidylprolyl isomerase [Paracoccaceae bacterium]